MKLQVEHLIDALGHCIGYGSEKAKYFFWGLEEKGQYADAERNKAYLEKFNKTKNFYTLANEEIYSKCKKCEDEDKKNVKRSKAFGTYIQLYEKLTNDEIKANQLGSKLIPVMIGNLKPFAKSKTADPYKGCEQDWINHNRNEENRNKHILQFLHKKAESNYVFCFGGIWEYKQLFIDFCNTKFTEKKFRNSARKSNVYFREVNSNLFLLRHPSNGWISREQICELLIELKPSLKGNCKQLH